MPGPKYDIVAVRKDGEEQTFAGYDGEERTSKFRKVGAVWERDGKLSLSFETALTDEDVKDCWFNLFTRKEKGGNKQAAPKKGVPPKKGAAPAGKKTVGPKKPAPPADEPFDDSDDSLDD